MDQFSKRELLMRAFLINFGGLQQESMSNLNILKINCKKSFTNKQIEEIVDGKENNYKSIALLSNSLKVGFDLKK